MGGGPSPTAPYAASDDEPDGLSPTAAAASSGNGEVEHSSKERSRRGSDERRSRGGSDHHRRSQEGDSRSTFKARVIKEVKTGAATSPASALPKPARRHHARSRTCTLACTDPQASPSHKATPAARCVAAALHGFFSAGRITSREDFKELAREVSHKILSKDPKKTTWDEKMPARVQKYVDQLFARDFIYDPSRNKKRKEAKGAK